MTIAKSLWPLWRRDGRRVTTWLLSVSKRLRRSRLKGEVILVVDDEEMILELAKTTLENYGYCVVTARNGLEAVACWEARKKEIRLVLTDTDMPLSDGQQLLQAIQKARPHIPIILASGVQQDTQWFTQA